MLSFRSRPPSPSSAPTAAAETTAETIAACLQVSPAAEAPPAGDPLPEKPDLYTLSQWQDKRGAYPWIECREGKLGCHTCSQIVHLKLDGETGRKHGLVIGKEWSGYAVEPSKGGTRANQLSSIRNKIKSDGDSAAHKKCVEILHERKKKPIETQVREMGVAASEATCRLMRTAYMVAKQNRPFTDFEHIVDLQQLNGIKLGVTLHGRGTCLNMIQCIADEMRRRIVNNIQEAGAKIATLVDEATTMGKKPVLVVFLKFCLDGEEQFVMFDLVELEGRGAETVANTIINTLRNHGFTEKFLQDNWVEQCSDDASVMLGKHAGVDVK